MDKEPDNRLLTPYDDVIVSVQALKDDDDFGLVESNAAFVEMLLAREVEPEEISRDAIRCYYISEFVFQFDNGGFPQHAFNSGMDALAVQSLVEALEVIGAKQTHSAYLQALRLWESLGSETQAQYLAGDPFGENVIRDQLKQANHPITDARDEEDLIDLAAQWLKSLETLKPVAESRFASEARRRSAKIPNLSQRKADRRKRIQG